MEQIEEDEEIAPSPKSISSDLTDKEFGEYMEYKIGLRTDGSGWMGEGEARAMRRGPVLFGDIPSRSLFGRPFRLITLRLKCQKLTTDSSFLFFFFPLPSQPNLSLTLNFVNSS